MAASGLDSARWGPLGTTPGQRHASIALLVADGLASWILASSREIGSLPVRTAAMEYPWTEHAETLIPIQTPVSGRSCIQPPRRSLNPVLFGLYYGAQANAMLPSLPFNIGHVPFRQPV
ncbi:hypothetical protein BKA56DRAFT_662258 [Ilyonectria sp. MPI-CAGE-AT-0026]|nr:hypothetical protein BKA56DRAFT_662258 [Ilyonectria sp. MPI-CAGE-AT-0026]